MNDFNLLPSEYQSKWKVEWTPIIIVVTIVLTVGSLVLMEWDLGRGRNDRIVIETSERKRLDLARLEGLSKTAESLVEKYEPLEFLVTNHAIWSNLLIEISRNTPEGLRLDSLSMNAKQGSCSMQGRAASSQLVLRFKDQLRGMPYFEEATISAIAQNPDADTKAKEVAYDISCKFTKELQ